MLEKLKKQEIVDFLYSEWMLQIQAMFQIR